MMTDLLKETYGFVFEEDLIAEIAKVSTAFKTVWASSVGFSGEDSDMNVQAT